MKFLHCSDIHLGRKPVGSAFSNYSNQRYEDYFNAFDWIIEFALENPVDVFLISGDLFDRRELSPDVLERAEKQLSRLKNRDIPVVAIEGNHDRLFAIEGRSWLEYLSREELLYLLRPYTLEDGSVDFPKWNGNSGAMVEIKGVRFYGMGYQGFSFQQYIEAIANQLDPSKTNVVLAHTAIGNPSVIPGCVIPEELEPLIGKCDYIAGGHIHTKHVYKRFKMFVPGAPEYWDIKEGEEKGFFIYDTLTKNFEFHNSKKRLKTIVSIFLENGSTNEFRSRLEEALRSNPVEDGSLYVVEVKVPFGSFLEVNISDVEKEIEEMGALKAVVSVSMGKGVKTESENQDLEVIEEDVIAKNPELASYSKVIADALENLKRYHEMNDEEGATETIDRLLNEIIGGDLDVR